MELVEAIKSRRSIRKFKSDPIPEGYITELIDAGRLAPSGTNLQPTRYVVIKSEKARAKLNECTPLPFVSAAPVVLACCVDTQSIASTGDKMKELREAKAFVDTPLDKDIEYHSDDNSKESNVNSTAIKSYLYLNAAIAIDHITLRAVDLGLESCCVMMFESEKVKNLLGFDDRYEVVALLPIGYPNQAPSQRPRLDIDQVFIKEI